MLDQIAKTLAFIVCLLVSNPHRHSSYVNLYFQGIIGLSALICHRRFFHPLRSFPGPWMNTFSVVPSALMLAAGRQHTYYYTLHAKYGPVVRTAPNELSFTRACAWNDIHAVKV